jgi:hypothetical protein
MSEREPPTPAPRSTQAEAATPNHAAPAPALPILPEVGYGAPPPVGLELHFGSITPEVAAASARRSQSREIRAAGLTPAPPSRDPAAPASSSPATYRSTSTDLTSGAYPEAASTSAQGVGQTGPYWRRRAARDLRQRQGQSCLHPAAVHHCFPFEEF